MLPAGDIGKCLEEQLNGGVRQGTVTKSQIPTLPKLNLRTTMLLSRDAPLQPFLSASWLIHLETQNQTQVKSLGSCTAQVKSHIIRTSFIKHINQQTSAFIIKNKSFPGFSHRKNFVPGTKGDAHRPCPQEARSPMCTSTLRFQSTPSLPGFFSHALLLPFALFTLIPSLSEKECFCCKLASLTWLRRLVNHHEVAKSPRC